MQGDIMNAGSWWPGMTVRVTAKDLGINLLLLARQRHTQTATDTAGSRQRRELGHTQRQPLDTVAREVDLGAGVVATAFQCQHRAFAKLGVK